jgi:leucine dehydrogenase
MTIEQPDWTGRELLIHEHAESGASFIIAKHSMRGGRAVGGTRINTYAQIDEAIKDAKRLAAGMALKWAAAGIEAGGGKAVIHVPAPVVGDDRRAMLQNYGRFVAEQNGEFLTGPDLGSTPEDMDIIAETAPGRVFGCTEACGGAGDPAPYTARGVFEAMQVVARRCFGDAGMAGRRVLLQGMGSVARQLSQHLRDANASVMFSDIDVALIERFRTLGLTAVPTNDVYATPCDLFSPCAIGGVLNEATISSLNCAAVVGAANNQLAERADGDRLLQRGIIYAPDFVTNAGGAIALLGIEADGMTPDEAMSSVITAIRDNLRIILDEAEQQHCSTDAAARALAQRVMESHASK